MEITARMRNRRESFLHSTPNSALKVRYYACNKRMSDELFKTIKHGNVVAFLSSRHQYERERKLLNVTCTNAYLIS